MTRHGKMILFVFWILYPFVPSYGDEDNDEYYCHYHNEYHCICPDGDQPPINHLCEPCHYHYSLDRKSHLPLEGYRRLWRRGPWFGWIEYLPEEPPLFRPFIADPRQPTFSVGWRFDDGVIGKNVIDVSYDNYAGLVRLHDIWPCHGEMELGIQGALWAIFDPLEESAPLVNADYYVAVPLTYAVGPWSWRLRGYHISSHIGDEFLLLHPDFVRKNPSAEYLDLFVSHYLTEEIRWYAGGGVIVHQDKSFPLGKWFAQGGVEVRLPRLGIFFDCDRLYGLPFFAFNLYYNNRYNKHLDQTYALGFEWGKTCGLCRRIRTFVEYHDGYSVEGQFRKFPTNYVSIRITYGF